LLQTALAKKDKCSLLNLWLCRFNLHCCYGRRVIGNGVIPLNIKQMDKKEQERIVLNQFIEAYKNLYNSNDDFKILDREVIQKKFSNYNGENPDFVVLLNENFVGIELFELVRDNLENLNRSNSEDKLKIKNAPHLYSIREKTNSQDLFLMEDLAFAALERINDKIKNKLNNYISCPIWLIGYANKSYNIFLLSPYFDDNIQNEVASYISKNIIVDDRIQKIFLSEFSNKYLLLQIK
jgi:hypothetical protein